jgi:LPXTG-motif cell wall-anchored protein
VVARGAADDEYAFEIEVVVPGASVPGEARLLALDLATGLTAPGDPGRPMVITPDLPLAADQPTALFEGSDQHPSTTTTEADDRGAEATSTSPPRRPSAGDDSNGDLVVIGLAVLAAIGLVATTVRARRRRHLQPRPRQGQSVGG